MSRSIRRSVVNDVHILIHGQAPKHRLAAAAGALGALACSGQIFAADATPAQTNTAPAADQQLEEIVVTGIRASLQKSLDIKQQSVGVVDAISAEDIGAFPDASLGEAMQRIPGITVTRTTATGMGAPELYTGNPSGVTVRGFGGDFTETLIDGRPLSSAGTRSFDFSSVGADFVGEVDVLKTPDYNLSSGAVGATVNIKFPKPFDHPGLQARAFGSMTETTNDGSFRPSAGALFSNTFFNDTVGILIDGDYADTRISSHHQDIVGWKGVYLNSCQMAGGPACLDSNGNAIPKNSLILANGPAYTPTNPKNTRPSWFPQEYQLYNDRTDDRRKDGRVVLQWHPTDALLVTVDDNYSDENLFALRYNYSTWFNSAQMYNVQQDTNGTITNFQYGPAPTDLDAGTGGSFIQNNTVGLNVKWDVNDQVRLQFDADQSASHLNPNGASFISVDVGYGPSYAINNTSPARFAALQAAGFPNAYVGGIAVPGGGNNLPYYNAYGPNNNPANVFGLNPLILGSHVLPVGSNRASDHVNQAKLDADWHTGNTEVDFGLQFVEDTRNAYNLSSFANNAWQLWSGYGSPSGNSGGQALPASLFANSGGINTSNFLPAFKNNGQLPPIFMYSPYAVYNYLTGLGAAGANPNTVSPIPPACTAGAIGCYAPYTGGPEPDPLDPGSISFVQEKSYSPFVTLQQKLHIADKPLTVNVGLRYERTNTTTGGYGRVPIGLTPGAQDHTAFVVSYSDAHFLTTSNQYSYFLPSLDLNFFPLAELKVRLDASRTLTRPPLNEITPTLRVAGSPRIGSLGLTGNNPGLLPYVANNFDLGAEWYYGQNEYLSVDGFFKHVSQFPEQQTVNTTLPGVIDPSTGQIAQWAKTTFVNSPTANVYGVEIGWQQMLVYGFGYQLNGTVVHTNEPYDRYNLGPQFFLPGLANSANFVGFYQNHGFQARVAVNWTATQLTATTQEQTGGQFGNEPVFTRPFTEVDFSTQYDINEHISVFFKALNLTDAEVIEHGRFDNQLLNVQEIGRTFTMGVRAKL